MPLQPMQRVHLMQSDQPAQPEESVHSTLVQPEPSQPSLSPVQLSPLEEGISSMPAMPALQSAEQTTSIVTHSSVQMSPAPPSDALNCEPLMEPESSLLSVPNNEELNCTHGQNDSLAATSTNTHSSGLYDFICLFRDYAPVAPDV
ncbi:hypothetical protein V6N11_056906 [Hibiscus sabdariffa]|uniref:Uncharacterized protein n=1 Tax=Hibiscus sabdariffa TaxID=183260 RepID=A0ABR2T664_9ROSI